MNRRLFSFFLQLSLLVSCTYSQSADTDLMKETELLLSSGRSTTGQILSDKKFDALHPQTEFRDLVKKYSTALPVKITSNDEPGKKIRVIATVKDQKGDILPDVLIYFYQTDSKGWYSADRPHVGGNEGDSRHARIFGYARTDKNGQFEIHTSKPAGYPQSDLPAHIHVEIRNPKGYRTLITEFLFDDDERLQGDIRQQSIHYGFPIAKPEPAPAGFDQQFTYTLVLN